MSLSQIKNILFITSNRLGDAVLSTGILNHLLSQYPEAQFTIACGSIAAGLFDFMPRRKETLVIEKRRFDFHWIVLWRQCLWHRWDLIIDLRGSGVSFFLWTKKRIIVYGGRKAEPKIAYLAKSLSVAPPPLPTVWTGLLDQKKAEDFLPDGHYIALAPTANWQGKVWPVDRFIALAQQILKYYPSVQFAIFYGPGEKEYLMAAPLLQAGLPIIDIKARSLSEVVALLQRCRAFVGNDSGLMHLAAAAGIPTLGLFGPSRVIEYAPVGKRTGTVVAPGPINQAPIEGLSVKQVVQAFLNLLGKED